MLRNFFRRTSGLTSLSLSSVPRQKMRMVIKGGLILSGITAVIVVAQTIKIRRQYLRQTALPAPSGPMKGIVVASIMDKAKQSVQSTREIIESKNDLLIEAGKAAVKKGEDVIERLKDKVLDKIDTKSVVKRGEIVIEKILDSKRVIVEKSEEYFDRVRETLESKKAIVEIGENLIKKKVFKLLVLGDSLACGIGCDPADRSTNGQNDSSEGNSPVLPVEMARILSHELKAEVQWECYGLSGATAEQIRTLVLPKAFAHLNFSSRPSKDDSEPRNSSGSTSKDSEEDVEYIVVVLCGLNDWKTLLTKFPSGSGPNSFRDELIKLTSVIKESLGEIKSKIIYPELPMNLALFDPECLFNTVPLKYAVNYVQMSWDWQKKKAVESFPKLSAYIEQPQRIELDSESGEDIRKLISTDGVHPSSQGYRLWAMHLAKQIILLRSD